MDRVYAGGDALCLHNAATGREQTMAHRIEPSQTKKKVVVVGGGPAGMEAARVAASRGHQVTLFEAADKLGGQVLLAARAGWRKDMIGIVDWLASEVDYLGVTLRLGVFAESEDILAETPDVVIVATGGGPNIDLMQNGEELADNAWDLLTGQVQPALNIMIYDEGGGHSGTSLADWLSAIGKTVELVSPDRHTGRLLGGQNYPVYLHNLYERGATLTPNHRLVGVRREGNRLIALLRNEYSRETLEREVDQVVVDQGTSPVDDVYQALVAGSRNLGELDVEAMVEGCSQPDTANSLGHYQLFRV
ncbi:MAG TPA: FAD-dependent oxidoreductase, partial [Candidatus Handelsmanbacteria bacterium]|nr:FAD-dependent oxidoreductase [Candidatus Handelsmanbacteria bacterium]